MCSPLSYVRSWFSTKTGISVVLFILAMTYATTPAKSSLSPNSARARSVPIPSLRCTLSGSGKVSIMPKSFSPENWEASLLFRDERY